MSSRKFSILIVLLSKLTVSPAFAIEERVSVDESPLPIQKIDLGISESYRVTQGSFDPYGTYVPNVDGSSVWSTTTNFKTGYRFSKVLESDLAVPLRESESNYPTGKKRSTTLGGAQLSGRYHLGGWPHILVHLGVGLPWKWSASKSEGSPAASISGDSASDVAPAGLSLRFGFGLSHTFGQFRFGFDATETYAFAQNQEMKDGALGPSVVNTQAGRRHQIREGLAYLINHRFSLNGSLNQMWLGESSAEGKPVEGTAGRVFSTSLGVSYFHNREWRWTASYETQYPFYAYMVNQPYSPAISISLSYAGLN